VQFLLGENCQGFCDQKGALNMTETKLRLWLYALTFLWVMTFIVVIALFRAETLRVSRVEVLNSQGKTVAVLGVSPNDGGVLLLYDANGSLRADNTGRCSN